VNWWYLIPILCGIGLLIVAPGQLLIMLAALPLIALAAWIMEKVFGGKKF